MTSSIPEALKIYHIVHIDRLASIVNAGVLMCDAEIQRHGSQGTNIGMDKIKQRRLMKQLNSYPDLHVGDCVPFYFCPRSVMLYMLWKSNHPEIDYHDGQSPIIHLMADFYKAVEWAGQTGKRWVFTNSNAGALYADDFRDVTSLSQIDWGAVQATNWQGNREKKQAEFLMESEFPWACVEKIGVFSEHQCCQVAAILSDCRCLLHRPSVCVERAWYY